MQSVHPSISEVGLQWSPLYNMVSPARNTIDLFYFFYWIKFLLVDIQKIWSVIKWVDNPHILLQDPTWAHGKWFKQTQTIVTLEAENNDCKREL